jgi:hypothetical protein
VMTSNRMAQIALRRSAQHADERLQTSHSGKSKGNTLHCLYNMVLAEFCLACDTNAS